MTETSSLNLAIVGGGKTCKSFLELLQRECLDYIDIRIVGVCDIDPTAEGFRLAQEMGLYTTTNFLDLFRIEDLQGIIELTGQSEVLLELIQKGPRRIGIMDHNIGRLLKDLLMKAQRLNSAEKHALLEKMAADFLIQQANERISVLSPDFIVVEANEAYLKTTGKSKEEVIGAHCYEMTHGLNAPCSGSQPGLGCPLVETLRTGKSAHVIHEHLLSGKPPTYCDLVTYPLKDEKGEVVRVIEISRDVTDQLSSRLENRIKALKEDLKRLIQEDRMISLGKLVASSVHEINNPIQGLLTFTQLMLTTLEEGELSPEDGEKFKKYLSLMSMELERCGSIVSGLLSFSRQSDMAYREVDLNDILGQVMTLTRHKAELQNIQLKTKLSTRPLVVRGDVNQLQQCFLNLIFNAIEAMEQGGHLSLVSGLDHDEKNALVEIKDTGCGIAEKDLGHIFDPFFTTKEESKGTGMGLSIVYGIVRNHGGKIEVHSQVGKGTSFHLSFPIR